LPKEHGSRQANENRPSHALAAPKHHETICLAAPDMRTVPRPALRAGRSAMMLAALAPGCIGPSASLRSAARLRCG
jgi:hypothetical protein